MRHVGTARGVGMFLAGALVGILLVSPASAHFTRNTTHLARHAWNDFIKPKVFTRAQANNRFLQLGGAAAGDLTGTYPDPSIANSAVTTPKIGNAAVSSAKIENGAVTSAKLPEAVVSHPKIADGAVRASKLAVLNPVLSNEQVLNNTQNGAVATCPAGTRVISGGANTTPVNNFWLVVTRRFGNGWQAIATNNSGAPQTVTAIAYCLSG